MKRDLLLIWTRRNKGMNNRGQAIFLVLGILTILFIVGVTMFYFTQRERAAAVRFVESVRSQYAAEAGVVYARNILRQDKKQNAVDGFNDRQFTFFKGEDHDVDKDGTNESRRLTLRDANNGEFARVAVLVSDEAGKVNINTAGTGVAAGNGVNLYEVNLSDTLSAIGLPAQLAGEIISYRLGPNGLPGDAGVDDNGNNYLFENNGWDDDSDGVVDEKGEGVDEMQECDPFYIYGDDRVWGIPEGVSRIESDPLVSDLDKALRYITSYSRDYEVGLNGSRRLSLRGARAQDVLEAFLSSGVTNAYKSAADFVDAFDPDLSQSYIDKYYFKAPPSGLVNPGGWVSAGGSYMAQAGSAEGVFRWQNLPLADGEYYCSLYGNPSSVYIGDVVYPDGKVDADLRHMAALIKKVMVSGGSFELTIRPNKEKISYLSTAELSLTQSKQGLSRAKIAGREAIVINEIMPKLSVEASVSANDAPGGDWIFEGDYFKNAVHEGGKTGEGKWVFEEIRQGHYYLQLLGLASSLVGDVSCGGANAAGVISGDYLPEPIYVGGDGELNVYIQNNSTSQTAYFKGIMLTQQPDAEYIELLNLSGKEVDLSNFVIEVYDNKGQFAVGYPAEIPSNTAIGSYEYLVLAVDAKDTSPEGLKNNGLSFKSVWGSEATGLEFDKTVNAGYDLIPDGGGSIMLKTPEGSAVDSVEYASAVNFVALERSDPTADYDSDADGNFDGWFNCLDKKGGTPGTENDNSDMYDIDPGTGKPYKHSIDEVGVFNRYIYNIADFVNLSSGSRWQKRTVYDLAKIADKFSANSLNLALAGNFVEGDWRLKSDMFIPNQTGSRGLWRWDKVPAGTFDLRVIGEEQGHPNFIKVGIRIGEEGEFISSSSLLIENGQAYYGKIAIPAVTSLEMEITDNSSELMGFNYLVIEPSYEIEGRININTAPVEVLGALSLSSSAIDNILINRPFGEEDARKLGTGELLISDTLGVSDEERLEGFRQISNLITVKSDMYKIISVGEGLKEGKESGISQVVTAVVQR